MATTTASIRSCCKTITSLQCCLGLTRQVNECNNEGRTALHIAVFKGDYTICERLLRNGATLTPDMYSLTPLHYAAYEGVASSNALMMISMRIL